LDLKGRSPIRKVFQYYIHLDHWRCYVRKGRSYGCPVSGVVACLVTRCGGTMGLTCLLRGVTAGHASIVTTPEAVQPTLPHQQHLQTSPNQSPLLFNPATEELSVQYKVTSSSSSLIYPKRLSMQSYRINIGTILTSTFTRHPPSQADVARNTSTASGTTPA
jgi:hypothetical protein